MGYWQIERSSDGLIAVIEAATQEEALRKFEEDYASDLMICETTADEYAEFQRDCGASDGHPWYG